MKVRNRGIIAIFKFCPITFDIPLSPASDTSLPDRRRINSRDVNPPKVPLTIVTVVTVVVTVEIIFYPFIDTPFQLKDFLSENHVAYDLSLTFLPP